MFKPKKSLGQHFLVDKNICKKIVKLTKIINEEIIEIGPGMGILTDEILRKKPKKVTLIEKDNKLFNLLDEKYKNNRNVELYNCDAINFNYRNLLHNKIISNLPYNISVKLIMNWLQNNYGFTEMVLMIQKEVAKKMDYKNQSKKNRLNFFMELAAIFKIEFNVSNNVFHPKPKIISSVIKIIPKKKLTINLNQIEKFTRDIFKHKRKKLSNVLKDVKIKEQFTTKILDKRAEDLSTNELLSIFNQYYSN